jgi:putative ABC transport system permease protein
MRPGDIVRVALRALLRNKLRSLLTALGIIIGVAAVIAMVAIGEGARARVEQAFSAMGTNVLIVSSGAKTSSGAKAGAGTLPTLTWDDLRAIRSDVADVRFVAPRVHTTAQVVAEDRNWSTMVTGTTPEFFDIRNWPVRLGAALTPEEVDSGARPDRRHQPVRRQRRSNRPDRAHRQRPVPGGRGGGHQGAVGRRQ